MSGFKAVPQQYPPLTFLEVGMTGTTAGFFAF